MIIVKWNMLTHGLRSLFVADSTEYFYKSPIIIFIEKVGALVVELGKGNKTNQNKSMLL